MVGVTVSAVGFSKAFEAETGSGGFGLGDD